MLPIINKIIAKQYRISSLNFSSLYPAKIARKSDIYKIVKKKYIYKPV